MEPFKNITYKVDRWAKKNGFPPVVVWIIGINLAVFLVYNAIDKSLLLLGKPSDAPFRLLAMPTDLPRLLQCPWTLVTSIFFHEGLWHILFNMLWLWAFSRLFLGFFSPRALVNVYLLGGMAGNLLCMLAYAVFPYFHDAAPISYILGASGAAMAVMLVAAMCAPRQRVYLWGVVSLEVRYLALIVVAIDLLSVTGSNAGGHIAHIGGALLGILYAPALRHIKANSRGAARRGKRFTAWKKQKRTQRGPQEKKENARPAQGMPRQKADDEKLQRILDKLSAGGYGALTAEEKEYLFNRNRR